MLGVAGQIYAHVNYLHNIENPDGHKRAMNNVQKIVPFRGINFMPFMRSRPYQISPDDASNQPTSEHDSSSTERSQSKWDQIRATNSRTAQSSAWDARRQQHEIIRVKPNPQDRDDDKWTSEKF